MKWQDVLMTALIAAVVVQIAQAGYIPQLIPSRS